MRPKATKKFDGKISFSYKAFFFQFQQLPVFPVKPKEHCCLLFDDIIQVKNDYQNTCVSLASITPSGIFFIFMQVFNDEQLFFPMLRIKKILWGLPSPLLDTGLFTFNYTSKLFLISTFILCPSWIFIPTNQFFIHSLSLPNL